MGDHNSLNIQLALDILQGLLLDLCAHTPQYSRLQAERDYSYCQRRTRSEGIGFLTSTLASLDTALLQGLETGHFRRPSSVKGYRALPLLLRGLLLLVFDESGMLRPDADPVAINDLRQIFAFFKKAEVPRCPKKDAAVLRQFEDVDASLPDLGRLASPYAENVLKEAQAWYSMYFAKLTFKDISPRHGPGAVAGREKLWEKTQVTHVYRQLQKFFPVDEYFFANGADLLFRLNELLSSGLSDCAYSRVVLVPKDSKGPRLIAAEPKEYQFIQQGCMTRLVDHIESHPWTRGLVNFSDQGVNQRLAEQASVNRELCTLDMKEASDRVSSTLLERLFPPHVLHPLEACRSPGTILPSGRMLLLRKFSPMGSAVCFPIESIVFFGLCRAAYKSYCGHLRGFRAYVYGDDLVVDRLTASLIRKCFPLFGLRFNEEKCFSQGYFRESCGVDAFKGVNVTPIRLRTVPSKGPLPGDDIMSLASTSNQLWTKCYYRAANVIISFLERTLRKRLPYALPGASYLGKVLPRHPVIDPNSIPGWSYHKPSCAWRVHAFVPVSHEKEVRLDGASGDREYFRKLTQGWHPDYVAGKYTVRHSVKLVRRRVRAFS